MTLPPEREIGRALTGALHHSTGSYELVIGAIAAGGVGYLVDRLVGSVPVFTLLFGLAGFALAGYGLWNNYRTQMQAAAGARRTRAESRSA